MSLEKIPFFCSWSGGKDSCLALYRAMEREGDPRYLLTTMIEGGKRSRSHGLATSLLQKQADLLGLKVLTAETSWEKYEDSFLKLTGSLRKEGIKTGVFGDIDLEDHREWVEKTCKKVGIKAWHPLWEMGREKAVKEFMALGFKAVVVGVNGKKLGPEFLGRKLEEKLIEDFIGKNVDPAGENGEYHTAVTGGPIFCKDLDYWAGKVVKKGDYWFLDIKV